MVAGHKKLESASHKLVTTFSRTCEVGDDGQVVFRV